MKSDWQDEYLQYLQSPEWETRRQARFSLDGNKCVCCGRPMDLQCHHLNYRNFKHEDVCNDLVTLCKYCHEDIEDRKHKYNWDVREQLVYIFIKKYKEKDVLFGGKENLNVYTNIEKYWKELFQQLHRTESVNYKLEIQNFFARKKEAFIKESKAKGATADWLRSRGMSEGMIHKYYYSKEDK